VYEVWTVSNSTRCPFASLLFFFFIIIIPTLASPTLSCIPIPPPPPPPPPPPIPLPPRLNNLAVSTLSVCDGRGRVPLSLSLFSLSSPLVSSPLLSSSPLSHSHHLYSRTRTTSTLALSSPLLAPPLLAPPLLAPPLLAYSLARILLYSRIPPHSVPAPYPFHTEHNLYSAHISKTRPSPFLTVLHSIPYSSQCAHSVTPLFLFIPLHRSSSP
jgi:hypothetical protein